MNMFYCLKLCLYYIFSLSTINLMLMNQVFNNISLSKNTGLKKIYGYKFSGKQACPSEDALGLVVFQAPRC
jgi:hypothetical protein